MKNASPDLTRYRHKRDFTRTREPSGAKVRTSTGRRAARPLSYVIQKHAARRLHYDFRLELDGVLLSWAVPKGPSLDPSVKRLAQETEPHPLEYGGFEGTIPKEQYGGGTVMVWDRGSWLPEGDARQGYAKGHLSFALAGDKLRGRWHLVRTKQGKDGKGWLLFKGRDEAAREDGDEIVNQAPDSALSGRDLEQIAKGAAPRPVRPQRDPIKRARKKAPQPAKSVASALPKNPLPKNVVPELATLVASAPEGDDWLHEIKFDGYRILARIEKGRVQLITRGGKDWTDHMPTLELACRTLKADSALIDGELVALNGRGVSDFQTLQNSLSAERDRDLVYYAFDLLHLDGQDLTALPLLDRKARLAALLENTGGEASTATQTIRFSAHVVGNGGVFFERACQVGLEGIVSKRAASLYRTGRGRDWLKIKCGLRQEFVIVGYTEPGGSRSHLGALLLGVQVGNTLRYSGRVGTGFTERSLKDLHARLQPLKQANPAMTHAPRGAQVRDVHWVKPKLVCEVSFTGFTDDGLLRHPSFQGLREDKPPSEVKLENVQ